MKRLLLLGFLVVALRADDIDSEISKINPQKPPSAKVLLSLISRMWPERENCRYLVISSQESFVAARQVIDAQKNVIDTQRALIQNFKLWNEALMRISGPSLQAILRLP